MMAIGSYLSCKKKTRLKKILIKICGTEDYHSHIRIRPLLRYIKKNNIGKNILEIGCGSGTIAFELYERTKFTKYIGVDLNKEEIESAKEIQNIKEINNMEFVCQDAFSFLEENKSFQENIDTVILFDFLEHINMPELFLKELNKIINNPNIVYLISVPTPIYPKVFGREFHDKIGHVVDGFTIDDVNRILNSIEFVVDLKEYSTGLIGNMGASLFYSKLKGSNLLKAIITLPFRIFDINIPKYCSAIFIVAKANKNI